MAEDSPTTTTVPVSPAPVAAAPVAAVPAAVVPEVPQEVTVRALLDAGLHFGHQTKRWNPKMRRYIFDKRNGIHIIDLSKSLIMLKDAEAFVRETVANGKSILFVGTKKQAQQVIKESAMSCGQFFVTHRWLGGTLTNNVTIRKNIKRMRDIENKEQSGELEKLPKAEASALRREMEKLRRNLGGIAAMAEMPGALFIVDINCEANAVKEANRLGIPVVAIVDTNCDPDPIDYVIPGNDDAIRAIKLIAGSLAEQCRQGESEYAKVAADMARRRSDNSRSAEFGADGERIGRKGEEQDDAAAQARRANTRKFAAQRRVTKPRGKDDGAPRTAAS